ncbi:UV DNA damage repair endonuclease UvsE [Candidatus Thorarchaeota archaeon]|nr:MAG: UV DNA damage repair endonuclease UvsE [Candidatus Thorarchaeota archaeon]
MRIGYACMNNSVGCTSASTFRLSSWSENRFKETVRHNLACLGRILQWNIENGIYFFRITSDLVPFASHPICSVDWQSVFSEEFARIGRFLTDNRIRVSMHPGQYTVLNSNRVDVVQRSILELEYHADVLDLINQGTDAKIVLHVGGVYGDKPKAIDRFVQTYQNLSDSIQCRLIIENDERSYTVQDCHTIYESTGIPIVVDNLHHEANNSGESFISAFDIVKETWRTKDGVPIIHYSSQEYDGRLGKHAEAIDARHFKSFLHSLRKYEIDVMLEVKDKEKSAIKAMQIAKQIENSS